MHLFTYKKGCPRTNNIKDIYNKHTSKEKDMFFGDFRCGALLFVVIHVIYKYKNR